MKTRVAYLRKENITRMHLSTRMHLCRGPGFQEKVVASYRVTCLIENDPSTNTTTTTKTKTPIYRHTAVVQGLVRVDFTLQYEPAKYSCQSLFIAWNISIVLLCRGIISSDE